MNYKVETLPTKYFQKVFKRLLKKYPSLKSELAALKNALQTNPSTGTPLGNNTFKIRLAIKSKGKGKSGGARVISYVETEIIGVVQNSRVNLLTIYDKAEMESISKEEIAWLIENMEFE
jgi:hypothetical protein